MEDLQRHSKDLQLAKQVQKIDQQAMMFLNASLDLEKGVVSAQVLLDGDVVKQVVSCLNSQSSSTSVLETVTELVAALFSHDAAKKAVTNKPRPIVDALFTCLRNNANMSVVQQHIFTAIGNLTDDKDPSQNWLLSDYDAISVVDVLKRSPSLADLQAQAYYALQKIAMGNKTNIGFLFNTHLAHQLALTSMTNHANHIPVQTQGCALLRRLSFLEGTHSVLMTTSTATVIQSMRSFATEPQIQEQGCAFINNMAFADANNQKLLVREPHLAHQVILSAMRNHPQIAAVQEQGCSALRNLAIDADNKKLLVREPYLAHQVILSAMRNHPQIAAIQEEGCSGFWSLAVDADNKKMLVREPHLVHQAILSAMRNHPQIAAVQEEGCGALRSLAIDADNQKLLVREPHLAHQVILSAMRNHPLIAAVQECGCAALAGLAVNADNQSLLVQNDAHTTVIAALKTHPHNEAVQLSAVWALSNLSYELSNRAVLKQADPLPLCEKAQRNFTNNNDLAARLVILNQNLA